MVCVEVAADEHNRRLSKVFEAVRDRGRVAGSLVRELTELVTSNPDTLALRHLKGFVRDSWPHGADQRDGATAIEGVAKPSAAVPPPPPELPPSSSTASSSGTATTAAGSPLPARRLTDESPSASAISRGAAAGAGVGGRAVASSLPRAPIASDRPVSPGRGSVGVGQGEGAMEGTALLDHVFGEAWGARVERIRRSSPHGRSRGWSVVQLMSKANDDVRQEVFVMQILTFLASVLPPPLRLFPYRILATGPSSGLIELVRDTVSLDRLKRKSGGMSLRGFFESAYGGPHSAEFAAAQRAFTCSLAAYCVTSYILALKDRHNGNLLLTRSGHLVHIDFGFILGRAPGGVASLEAAVPFKLPREYVDVMGGPDAPLFTETFVELCTTALRTVREHADSLLSLTEITSLAPRIPCFASAGRAPLEQMRARLMLHVPDEELRERVRELISISHDHMNTYLYDRFQKLSNGIAM